MKLKILIMAALATVAAQAYAVETTVKPAIAPNIALQTAKPIALQPQLIVRKPVKVTALGAVTNRQLPKSTIAEMIGRGLKPVSGAIVGKTPPKPTRKALLIVLENGGVMNNVDPQLRRSLNVNINTVTCEGLEFELPQGRTIVDLLADIGGQIGSSLNCLNPGNWRQTTFNPLTWLNEQSDFALEAAITANNSLINTQSRYERVVVMEDADAVPARVLAMIRELAPQYVLDLHVLTHGDSENFVGHNNARFNNSNFFSVLDTERKNGLPLYLRAVYQMNCRGGTLKDNWRSLGAITVNGTVGTALNNMPHQYFHFLQKWLNGTGMSDASNQAFNEAAAYSRPIYTLAGQGALIDVSRLPAEGSSANANVNSSR
ncbi:MAG TPA: hypothetical protein VFS58_17180 [Steroidobacteraceae bacterium]|nr:hypothetical protein [Steroidobacteraceae bacterium]